SHFSNTGSWVRAYRPGTAIVSTMPTTFDAALQASAHTLPANAPVRGTADIDNFSSGFGIWSGTSFSAPIFVGELAQRLVEDGSNSSRPLTGSAERPEAAPARVARACRLVDELCAEGDLR